MVNVAPRIKDQLEICFTGFPKKQRAELEQLATANNMRVCKSVTSYLDLLCCGDNAGPKKMEKAEKQGVTLMSADELLPLIQDGIWPSGV